MPDTEPKKSSDRKWDVVVCGAGLAGLLLARQIRQEFPDTSVAVVDRTRRPLPDACHKVGESLVELGSQYLTQLGLEDYLRERHLFKLGLRFFPGFGHRPLAERTEIGPTAEPVVRSYQIDRGRFEDDLRGMIEADGATLFEGMRVRDVQLGKNGANHVVLTEAAGGDAAGRLEARWVVDATGRAALLRRDLKLTRGARHAASAGWFRVAGRVDINDLVPRNQVEWHRRPCASERWRSTNHFMGSGYWVWVIPLSTGHTSIGLVIHEETHDWEHIASLPNVRAFLGRHEPFLARALENADVRDFLCRRRYSHAIARAWSADRWAIVGEAGAFVDPLYSPGTDFIALSNCFTTEMLRTERTGGDLTAKAGTLNAQYRAFVAGGLDLFRQAAPVYGHARAMAAKVYWDNFVYWSFTCQYFQQGIYRLSGNEHAPFDELGRRFLRLTSGVQTLLRIWAEISDAPLEPVMRAVPAFPSILIDAHLAVARRMSTNETLAYMQQRAEEGREVAVEIVLRAVQEIGPEAAQRLLERSNFAAWETSIAPGRLETEALIGRRRRKRLSPISLDVQRNLGPPLRHPEAAAARRLLAAGSSA